MISIAELIRKLALEPHPEGGFYRRTYASAHPSYSSILFLLVHDNFSAFHRIASDEQWNWYAGDDIVVHEINPAGHYTSTVLSGRTEILQLQHIVKAGNWFASECKGEHGFALCGCTVIPAFSFETFELAERSALQAAFPQHTMLITSLTRI
jgi:uncharacterized protein